MTTKTIGSGTTLAAGYGAINQTGFSLTNLGVLGAASAAYGVLVEATGDAIYNSGKILAAPAGGKAIFANQSLRITNLSGGTISAGNALYLLDGGTVSNASGALITGARPVFGESAGVVVRNQGIITGTGTSASQAGVLLKAGGYVYNTFGATISGANGVYEGASSLVRNAGSIRGNGDQSGVAGVTLNAGGTVTNASKAGEAAAAISGAYAGVIISNKSGYVYNDAQITGGAAGAFLLHGGTLNNSGGTVAANYDVAINGAYGFVENTGLINGGKLGVGMNAGGLVINAPTGTIKGTQAVQITGGSGSVYNFGVIDAGTSGFAVSLPAGFNNVLTIAPGGAFIGTVSGGNTLGASNSSKLELEIGTKTGTIGGIGTQFVDFNQIYVRPNANWSITSGSVALNTTVEVQANATLTNDATIRTQVTLLSYYLGSLSGIAGPAVVNAAGGTIGAGTINGVFGIYDPHAGPGNITLPADTIINDGRIGAATGIKLVPRGVITNQSQGDIYGNVALFFKSSATVVNQGLLLGQSDSAIAGVYLGGGGTVINEGTAGITGSRGVRAPGYARVENYSVIEAFGGTIPLMVEGSTSASRAGVLLGSGFVTNGSTADIKGPHFGVGIGYKTSNKGTVVNAGRINAYETAAANNAAIYLFNGGQVTNQSGGLITAVGTGNVFGVRFHGSSGNGLATGTLVNQGSISVPTGLGFYSNAGGAISNTGTGAITALLPVMIVNGTASVDNQGTLSGSTGTKGAGVLIGYGYVLNEAKATITAATGIVVNYESGTVNNKGLIAGNNLGSGVYLGPGGAVTNAASARISGGIGVWMESDGLIVNRGSIDGVTYGVSFAHGGTITNTGSGEISGTIGGVLVTGISKGTVSNSDSISGGTFGISLATGGSVNNNSGGIVSGGVVGIGLRGGGYVYNGPGGSTIAGGTAVSIAGGPGTVETFGYIDGIHNGVVGTAVTFASGFTNKLAIGAGFKFVGNIDGGNTVGAASTSTLELLSAGAPSTLPGLGQYFVDFANFYVDPFANWSLAANGSIPSGTRVTVGGNLTNNGKVITPVTLTNSATFTNASGATVSAGLGVYSTAAAPAVVNSGNIQGDPGADGYGVRFNAGGSVSNFGTIGGAVGVLVQGGAGYVTNFGTIQSPIRLAAGFANHVAVAPGAVFQATVDGGNTIGAPTASTLELLSASSTGSLVPANYKHFSNILVDQGAAWVLPTGTPIPAGSIVSVSGTLTNNGTVLSPVVLVAGTTIGAVLSNASGALISGAFPVGADYAQNGQAVTLTNSGTISGAATAAGASGVDLSQDAVVTNQRNALIRGAQYGMRLDAPKNQPIVPSSTITNYGSIIADGAAGAVSVADAVYFGAAGGMITNAQGALISASSTGTGVKFGPPLKGSVVNQGTISGYRGILGQGVGVSNASTGQILTTAEAIGAVFGSVDNQGLITSTSSLAMSFTDGFVTNRSGGTISGENGIRFEGAGTVVNYGLIAGTGQSGYSVNLGAGGSNLLVVHPGATFVGGVNGGNTIGSPNASTLELASGASAGTLTGLGSHFVNFAQVDIDASATWALTGQNSLAAGAMLNDDGAALDVGGVFLVDGRLADSGVGSLNVSGGRMIFENQGGLVSPGDAGLEVGQAASGGEGEIDVIGTKSAISNGGSFIVGDDAVGTLKIESGGTATTSPEIPGVPGLIIANTASASGSAVDLSGTGSTLSVSGLLDIGVGGSGALSLSGGATVSAGSLDAASSAAAVGQISLSGTGTALDITGDATVADDGTGVMSVLSGATFSAASLTIGAQGDSSGALVVSGAGSVINLTGALNIGTALGTGDLTIGPGAAVHASVLNLQGQVVLEGGLLDPTVSLVTQGQTVAGFGTIAASEIVDEGVIQAGGGKPSQKLLVVDGVVSGGGTPTVNGTPRPSNATGILQINAGGTMELTGAVLSGTPTFTDNLTPAATYTVANSVVDVTFADAAGVLVLDSIGGFGGTVTSYRTGDAFVIPGGTLSGLGVVNGTTLTVNDRGANAGAGGVDRIVFGSSIDPSTLSIVNGDTIVACFAEGTLIETETGAVRVEDLAVGDRVLTHDGSVEPIVWLGSRRVDCARHPAPETVWPVRVAQGAFGENVPQRALYLSPDHAVFVNDVLIPVKLLINGGSITQVKRNRLRYFHVELPDHAVVLAEGLPVESYLDTGDRADFAGGDTTRLFPDFAPGFHPNTALLWETNGAAPLVMTGSRIDKARRRLMEKAPRQPGPPRLKVAS